MEDTEALGKRDAVIEELSVTLTDKETEPVDDTDENSEGE